MTPTEIENLLHQGAQRRGWSVEKEREYVNELADRTGNTFEDSLWILSCIDTHDPVERERFSEFYQRAEEEAAQMGVTVEQLMEAYLRIARNPPTTQKH